MLGRRIGSTNAPNFFKDRRCSGHACIAFGPLQCRIQRGDAHSRPRCAAGGGPSPPPITPSALVYLHALNDKTRARTRVEQHCPTARGVPCPPDVRPSCWLFFSCPTVCQGTFGAPLGGSAVSGGHQSPLVGQSPPQNVVGCAERLRDS